MVTAQPVRGQRLDQFRGVSDGERQGQRRAIREIDENLAYVLGGGAEVGRNCLRAHGYMHDLPAPAAERKYFLRVAVGSDLQPIEIRRLRQ